MMRIYRKYIQWAESGDEVSFILPRPMPYCTVIYTNVRLKIYAQNEQLVGIVEPGSYTVLAPGEPFETCKLVAEHVARTFIQDNAVPTPRFDRGETLAVFSEQPIEQYVTASRTFRWLDDYIPIVLSLTSGEEARIYEPSLPIQASLGYMFGQRDDNPERTFIYPLRPGIKPVMDDGEVLATGLYGYETGWRRLLSSAGRLKVLADIASMPTANVNVVNTPTVNVGTMPTANVNVVNTPTVNVGTMPTANVNVVNTPTVNVGTMPTANVNVVNTPTVLFQPSPYENGHFFALVTAVRGSSFSLTASTDVNLFTIRGTDNTKDVVINSIKVTPLSLSAAARIEFYLKRYTGTESGGTPVNAAPLNVSDGNATASILLTPTPSGIISTPRASRVVAIGVTSATLSTANPPPETISYEILSKPVIIPKTSLHGFVLQANASAATTLVAEISIEFREI